MSGCREYVKASVDIFFTGDTVRCAQCPLLETYSRNMCRRTGEYIVDTKGVGIWCPLEIEEENNEFQNVER